jgi:hypothetical protein
MVTSSRTSMLEILKVSLGIEQKVHKVITQPWCRRRLEEIYERNHYTGTDPEHFQNFVIFTNYQFYVDAFSQLCHERMSSGQPGYDAFVEPGNVVTRNKRLGGGTSGVA